MTPTARPQARRPTPQELAALVPLGSLSAARLAEVAGIASVEYAARGADPLAELGKPGMALFLLRGELLLAYRGGGTLVVVGGHGDGRHRLNRPSAPIARSRAITDLEILVVESEDLDILMTFEQAAGEGGAAEKAFSLANLRHGTFSELPPARIVELFARFERIALDKDAVVVREGDEGDYYYVVESGRCRVERRVGGVIVEVAELASGDAFGEEALVSDARRNATVVMASAGALLRLGKRDFDALLRAPLLQRLRREEAAARVAAGAQWIDVRYPSEYRQDRLPGAVNIPLNEVRNSFAALEAGRELVVYCQSGRRSSAAAFLFAQRGFRVSLLDGGLWGEKS